MGSASVSPSAARRASARPGPEGLPRDYARDAFVRYRDHLALVTERGKWTYGEMGQRIRRLANLLDSLGVGAGDFLGVVASPRPEIFYEIGLARAEHGATLFGVSPLMPREDIVTAFQSASPKVVIYDADFLPQLPVLLKHALPGTRFLAARGPLGEYEGLLPRMPTEESRNRISPDFLTTVGYTSGTTGRPKGVTMSQWSMAESCRRMIEVTEEVLGGNPAGGYFTGVPIFAAGGGMVVPALATGATNYIPDRFDGPRALRLIQERKIAGAFLTPSMLIDLLDSDPEGYDLSSLRYVTYGSANMPVPKIEEAVRRMGPIFLQGYGMSELLPPVSVLWPHQHGTRERPAPREVLSSAGLPVEGVGVRVESEDGQVLSAGDVGEIVISSSTVTPGYWKDPAKTADSLRNGWWRSSDIGFLDSEGRVHVIDRAKDVMRRDSRAIYPRHVEEAAHDHPAIKEAAAVQTSESGTITLAVSLRSSLRDSFNQGSLALELADFLKTRLSPEDLPDEIQLFPELPRSLQGKVLKREVRDALDARK